MIPSEDTGRNRVAEWRRKVLDFALQLAFVVLLFATLTTGLQGRTPGLHLAVRLLPGLIVVVAALLYRRAPIVLRGWAMVFGYWIAIFAAGVHQAYAIPNPFVGTLFVSVLAALVFDRRSAWLALAGTCALWVVVAALYVTGGLTASPVQVLTDATRPGNWLRVIGIYAALSAGATGAVLFMVHHLEEALVRGAALYAALESEAEERIRVERARHGLEQQLLQAQRTEALARLAGGVAHDFNNLLQVIAVNAELAAGSTDETQRSRAAEDILAATDQASTLTRQLLASSRQQTLETSPIDVAASVTAATRLLDRLLPPTLVLEQHVAPDLPAVHGPPLAVEQILTNLVLNARDAMPAGGRVQLRVDVVGNPRGEEQVVLLEVADRGCGMDPNTLEHAFQPFFTTKAEGGGTGLGLGLVKGLAARCQGFVEASSQPGEGSVFRVYLPIDPRGVGARDEVRPPRRTGQGQTVVVVDDEPLVRRAMTLALERAGYLTLVAAHGEEALRLIRDHPEVELVVSDAIMPTMGGSALLQALEVEFPTLPFVLCSGYTADLVDATAFERPDRAFLGKPVRPAQLIDTVGSLLDRT